MNKRTTAVLASLALILLAGCDNSADLAKQAPLPDSPTAPSAPPAAEAPSSPASAPSQPGSASPPDSLEKPPGADPAKLAQHARALEELGYQTEATKLYTHACNWGYLPACDRLKTQSGQRIEPPAAAQPPAGVAKPGPTPVTSKPEKLAAVAPARLAPMTAIDTGSVGTAAKTVAPPTAKPAQPAPAPQAPAAAPLAVAPTPQPAAPAAQAAPSLPSVQAASPRPAPVPERLAAVDTQKLSRQAHGLEQIGYAPVAVRLYKDACLAGDGQACKRLGEIFISGTEGVERDYAESIRWYGRARQLGVAVPTLEKRTVIR